MSEERILFIEIFQPFAQYRNPFTFYYAQTYPLPPKSTIVGMLQNACDDWYGSKFGIEKWWNLKVSVHGGFESVFWNYQSLIKGELALTEKGIWINRHDKNPGGNIWLPLYGAGVTSQRSPVYQQELFNGHLYIFIKGNSEMIEKIKEGLNSPKKVLSLGRSEDVIFIKKVEELQQEPCEGKKSKSIWLTFPTYILNEIPIKNKKYPVYSIPLRVIFENNGNQLKHKCEITKDTMRKVDFKSVVYTSSDYVIYINNDVEVERYKIDGNTFKIVKNYGWL